MLDAIRTRLAQFFSENSSEVTREILLDGVAFANLLPYDAFDEEAGLFVNRGSLGFVLEAIPLVGGDKSAEKIVASIFSELIEEGASLQCLLFADHRIDPFLNAWQSARQKKSDILARLAKNRADFFRKSEGMTTRTFRLIFSYSVPFEEKIGVEYLQTLKRKKEKFLETLRPLTYVRSWLPEDLLECVGGLVNFSMAPDIVRRKWNPYESLSNQLTTGGKISVEEGGLQWATDQKTEFKSFRTLDFPAQWSLNHMQALIGDVYRDSFRLHTPFVIHYGIHLPKQDKAESDFWKRSYLIENQGRSMALLRWIPELERELKECHHVRKSLTEGARFVWTSLSVGLWATKEQMHPSEQVLKSLFRIHQFLLAEDRYVHLPQFLTTLPMTWAEHVPDLKNLNLLRTTISTECAQFVPMQGEWMGTANPGMLLTGRRGQLLNWNPFDNKVGNYNSVVVGRSGSGKSVFMQDLLVSGLSTGAKVYILEVGRSFEKLCALLEGQQIEFSKESQICLNPFTHISDIDTDDRDTSFGFLKSVIACMAAPTEGTSDYENAVIENAIRACWEKKKNQSTISDIAAWLLLQKDARANTLGTMLSPYTKEGVYAKHFQGENNVHFNREMVWIELEELKGKKDLQAVVLQLFIMEITQQAFLGSRKDPFYLCIDEAWDLLRGPQSGLFIETLARRLRKYNGALIIGTQSIEDFFASPGAKAAFENSDWMCLLSQKKSSITALAESGKLDFDETRRYALDTVTTRQGEYSEVMICDAEGNYSIARLVLDPFSELLYTTKAEDFAKIKDLRVQGASVTEAIHQLLAMKGKYV